MNKQEALIVLRERIKHAEALLRKLPDTSRGAYKTQQYVRALYTAVSCIEVIVEEFNDGTPRETKGCAKDVCCKLCGSDRE